MGLFAFDQQYAMFDATPVQNQFILEYMPSAPGDYVKVYLYGLMRCCHPSEEMTLAQMSHDLNLSEEDIRAAYRHWERPGPGPPGERRTTRLSVRERIPAVSHAGRCAAGHRL